MMPQPLRILIADDHAAVRNGVRALVQSRPRWTVCAEAADGEEAVELAARLRPDVALLDFQMPELNGIEAARQIRKRAPTVQVFMLTMHDSRQLRDDAFRAGARDVITKTDADSSLLDAIETLTAPNAPVALAGSMVRNKRHVAAFFQSEQERYRILGPFIAEGIACGDKALHIIDAPDRERHIRHLEDFGIDAPAAEARHQLDLLSWAQAFLPEGHFDQLATIAAVRDLFKAGKTDGYPRTRGVAYMEWALGDQPGVSDIAEYEARLNDAVDGHGDVVICVYDLKRFRGDVILDVMRGHPAVIMGGRLRENPFYTPPAAMIEELRHRQSQ